MKHLSVILIRFFGVVYLLMSVWYLLFYSGGWMAEHLAAGQFTYSYSKWPLVWMVVLSFLGVIVALGVLMLRNWARCLMVGLAMFWVVWSVWVWSGRVLAGNRKFIQEDLFCWFAWHVLLVWYFLRPGVKAQFQKRA